MVVEVAGRTLRLVVDRCLGLGTLEVLDDAFQEMVWSKPLVFVKVLMVEEMSG